MTLPPKLKINHTVNLDQFRCTQQQQQKRKVKYIEINYETINKYRFDEIIKQQPTNKQKSTYKNNISRKGD